VLHALTLLKPLTARCAISYFQPGKPPSMRNVPPPATYDCPTGVYSASPNVAAGAISGNTPLVDDTTHTVTTSESTIGSFTLATSGGYAAIHFKVTLTGLLSSPNAVNVIVRLRKGTASGTILDRALIFPIAPNDGVCLAIDASPAASQDYTITALHDGSTGSYVLGNIRVVAINMKK